MFSQPPQQKPAKKVRVNKLRQIRHPWQAMRESSMKTILVKLQHLQFQRTKGLWKTPFQAIIAQMHLSKCPPASLPRNNKQGAEILFSGVPKIQSQRAAIFEQQTVFAVDGGESPLPKFPPQPHNEERLLTSH